MPKYKAIVEFNIDAKNMNEAVRVLSAELLDLVKDNQIPEILCEDNEVIPHRYYFRAEDSNANLQSETKR